MSPPALSHHARSLSCDGLQARRLQRFFKGLVRARKWRDSAHARKRRHVQVMKHQLAKWAAKVEQFQSTRQHLCSRAVGDLLSAIGSYRHAALKPSFRPSSGYSIAGKQLVRPPYASTAISKAGLIELLQFDAAAKIQSMARARRARVTVGGLRQASIQIQVSCSHVGCCVAFISPTHCVCCTRLPHDVFLQ